MWSKGKLVREDNGTQNIFFNLKDKSDKKKKKNVKKEENSILKAVRVIL